MWLGVFAVSCKERLLLVGFEWYEEEVVAFLHKSVYEEIGLVVEFAAKLAIPKEAYNVLRGQYLASTLVEALLLVPRREKDIVLGISAEDIYEPNLNFVFGLASPLLGVGVIGLKRLHNSFYGLVEDRALFLRRTATEAHHETGHMLGLSHCPNPHCVMHFSNTLQETDRKGYRFCLSCHRKLEQKLC